MMKRCSLWPSLLIIVPLLLFVPAIWAADFQVISTSELKGKLDAKEKFLLVNALSDIEFNLEHIPGSVNIPVGEIKTTDKLPKDKETLIVFY
jgi:rhodanese-related sulfurtransferase